MTLSKKSLLLTGFAAVAALMMAQSASANTFYFTQITNNGNVNIPSTQMHVEVTAGVAPGTVNFQFWNDIGVASSITDIYFDDGTLLGISTISDSGSGVAYSSPANGNSPNLPSGNNVGFFATQGFSADPDSPVSQNGINAAGEWVTITFNLINGQTFANTLEALADGSLMIGIHVQAIGGAGSESFVNTVPDGGVTMSLLGIAMAGLGLVARRKK